MSICIELLAGKPSNGCKQLAGINENFYIGHTANIASYTQDATLKSISGITMLSGKKLFSFQGRRLENSAGAEATISEAGTSFKQDVIMVIDYNVQTDKDILEKLCQAESLFILYLSNRGIWRAVGLNKDPNLMKVLAGVKCSAAVFPEGKAITDLNAATITFTGQLSNLPVDVLIGASSPNATTTQTALDLLTV